MNLKNKKALTSQILILLGIAMFFILMIGLYFVWSMAAPLGLGIFNSVSNGLLVATHNETPNNLSIATAPFVTNGQATLANLKWLGYSMLVVGILGFMIFAYTIRTYPFFLFIWIFFVIIFAVISMYISNVYQTIPPTSLTGGFVIDNFIMTNLPAIVISAGIFLGIILFIIPSRDPAMSEASI